MKICTYPVVFRGFLALLFFQFCFLSFCRAQDNPVAFIQSRLHTYNGNVWQEKLYVHSDKSFYITGEIVWFKLYLVDALSNRPAPLSKVGYVEILDKNNKPVEQGKIALSNGEGNGSFHLPLTISSGHYKLRAYTNWMKNFDAALFFEKVITIVNPLKAQPAIADGAQLNYSIEFFPEGGHLVRGIRNKLAFKIKDQYGRGINGKGWMVNQNNDTVAVFQPLRSGIGSFYFLPDGNEYKALVKLPDGTTIAKELPKASTDGYAMSLTENGAEPIAVSVKANSSDQQVFLVAQARQLISFTGSAVLKDGSAVFFVDRAKLREGVNQFAVFNSQGKTLCERLYFKKPSTNGRITAAVDKESYSSRQKVTLSFLDKKAGPEVQPARLSLAVYRVDEVQPVDGENMATYLWLSSEVNDYIESPSYYLFNDGEEVRLATDNLMLTLTLNKFAWETVLNGGVKKHLFPLEYNGHLVTAKLTEEQTGAPAGSVRAFLSIPGSALKLFASRSDSAGFVQFDVKNFYGAGEAVVQTDTEEDSTYRISMLNPYIEKYSARQLPPFLMPPGAMDSLLEDYSIGMQVQNIYAAEKIKQFLSPDLKDTLPFYGRPSTSYALDDYKRFTTMEEVLREYVREINVGTRNGKLFLKLFDQDRKDFFDNNILMLLNGIPMRNINEIFSYDPLKFKTLDIIPRPYTLGPFSFMGLVSFSTYAGDLKDLELDPRQVALDYEGLQLQREFYAPVYETAEQYKDRTPDFRNTLFWKSEIPVTGETPEIYFFTCDQKGKYVASWQGIDAEGKIIAGDLVFTVNN